MDYFGNKYFGNKYFGPFYWGLADGKSWNYWRNEEYRSIDWNINIEELVPQLKEERKELKKDIKDLKQQIKLRKEYQDPFPALERWLDEMQERLDYLNELLKLLKIPKLDIGPIHAEKTEDPKALKRARIKKIVILLVLLGRL